MFELPTQKEKEGLNHITFAKHVNSFGYDANSPNSKVQNNKQLMDKRDRSVCKNLTCSDVTEYPLDLEFCPACNKRLTKTVQGSNLFVLV